MRNYASVYKDVAVMAIPMSLAFETQWQVESAGPNSIIVASLSSVFNKCPINCGTQNNGSDQFSAIRKSVSKLNYPDSGQRFNVNF
jgi:hypothetical protein